MIPSAYPYIDVSLLDDIVGRLRRARLVQIVGHVNPDGDCIGSMLAMHHLLAAWGVPHALAARKMGSNGYDQLAGFDLIAPEPVANPDLVLYVDTATLERGLDGWAAPAPVINIDHHDGNTRFGLLNWIEPRFAATGEMVYHLAMHAAVQPSAAMADDLLLALTTDTGSFRYGNTGADQHRLAARLIEAGASTQAVARIAYETQPPESLRITGHVLSNLKLEADGGLAWSELRLEDCRGFGGPERAPENLVSALRSVRGVRLCLLFHELGGGRVRVNFRSDGSLDVSRLAARWGGGGHECAAGLLVKDSADYEKTRDAIIGAAVAALG